MARLSTSKLALMLVSALAMTAMFGCKGEEAAKPEPEASKAQATQEGAAWTPEQKAAFTKAHEEARAGK
ncbi:MAG: hypothetical protein K8R88_04220 [Armatimonadetes bacterium]|nr:hypothetical protein [Armatimonadota bacterium]